MEIARDNVETRPWSDLPQELLSPVANRLGIIELLGFRDTCKDWRSASSTASAEIESSRHRKPWFLLYAEGNQECKLNNVSEKIRYSINIPELEESACLASIHGWLLLFNKGAIFFFCPLTRAKMELPDFPYLEISDHVATFSAPPTSKKCIVCVISRKSELKVELNFLKRGELKWEKVDYACTRESVNIVSGATFHEECFYFLDKENKLLTYSFGNKKWGLYRIVESKASDIDQLPFDCKKQHLKSNGILKDWLNLVEDASISTCGTLVETNYGVALVYNESIEASKEEGEIRKLKGIWIHPRFHQVPPNQNWFN
ncbi:hypothetical protein Vadar_010210 [Vaccinium darrowii]|uniref:Uncharacterized protein n=1 Tax=Vaccinium darrowii TaxID=229202 RepID=A0ACB7X9T4_9ERIC|nr:hypothetical protein Vadar_010210 [Vaccinium darrowii]